MDRRTFLGSWILAGLGASFSRAARARQGSADLPAGDQILSTWDFGERVHREAFAALEQGGSPVDAAQRGVMVVESDPSVDSVGIGGRPNLDGVVELDAAIMDGVAVEAGSVAALRGIEHPVAVARLVMDRTPHVMLVGKGALQFALSQGFSKTKLLTPEARARFKAERKTAAPAGHDTIGMIVRAADGRMAVACTTSGMAFKLPGRVGDSPLVGHGLYCDAGAGGAAATGIGEEVSKVCGSYQVVEFMRQGLLPDEAIRRVIGRMVARDPRNRERLIGFVAMRADGKIGAGRTAARFQAALTRDGEYRVLDAPPMLGS